MISQAPAIASSGVLTSFSGLMKALASSSRDLSVICRIIIFARGSNPFSFAIVARVRLFGRYGRYKSSTATCVVASKIAFFNSSVKSPCSSIEARHVAFFSSRLRKYDNLSERVRSCSSLRPPVASFLYREINGTVFPSSNSLIAAST